MIWQRVLKDFGKRNPDVTNGDVFEDVATIISNIKFSILSFVGGNDMLAFDESGFNILKFRNGANEYFSNSGWKEISQNVLLRFLVDGKEDEV